MYSVTGRVKVVKQPRGGYIKPSEFTVTQRYDGKVLFEEENVHATIVGVVVDYLTRLMMGADIREAFHISLLGYERRTYMLGERQLDIDKKEGVDIFSLIAKIKGVDDDSIIAACQAATYDVWKRDPIAALRAKGAVDTIPDKQTIENIRIMVERSVLFWKEYGEVTVEGFVFAEQDQNGKRVHNGYTEMVSSGDGDYLTKDVMWEFKVSKSKPTNKHTLQLAMYWIMGQHSGMNMYKDITKLGIFNPRLHVVYLLDVNEIPKTIIEQIEKEVICY